MASKLSIKNIFIAFVALNIFSLVLHPRLPDGMPAAGTFSSSSRDQAPDPASAAAHDAESQQRAEPAPTRAQRQSTTVVKVLDLPNSEALRFGENTFVDLGWRQTAGKGGEWVGHIGSSTESVPLNTDQIAGILKEAQLKALPPPPGARVQTPRTPPKDVPAPPEAINLLDWVPMLMGIFFMMYIRYRITQVTLDAAQGAAGLAQSALSQLLSAAKAKVPSPPAASKAAPVRAPNPVGMSTPIKTSSKSSTVVRPAPGLFGFMMRSR